MKADFPFDNFFKTLADKRIAVFGDFSLDNYVFWDDEDNVIKRNALLKDAALIAATLKSLGAKAVSAVGFTGSDSEAAFVRMGLEQAAVDTTSLSTLDSYITPGTIRHITGDEESLTKKIESVPVKNGDALEAVVASLKKAVKEHDALVLFGDYAAGMIMDELRSLVLSVDIPVVSDNIAYGKTTLVLNDQDAANAYGGSYEDGEAVSYADAKRACEELTDKSGAAAYILCGEKGIIAAMQSDVYEVNALNIISKTEETAVDESAVAGVAAAYAAGLTFRQAADAANFVDAAASQNVFAEKIVSAEGMRAAGMDADYIYKPERAEDIRKAVYFKGSEIEIVNEIPSGLTITHAIFDHDGTISTLRQGWEHIMEPVMMKAILGDMYSSADDSLYRRVQERSRDFIDKTTGIQTLVQMQGLVKLVREFGVVPEEKVLDEFGYKEIYNNDLIEMVNERIKKFENGELSIEDYTMKNAVAFLHALKDAGVTMYLASGTDEEDVKKEAEALGYGDVFEGRIYGAVGDVTKEAKKMVLERILNDIGRENVKNLMTLGDGPVEIRETHKRGGITIGIASDEVQRFGLNPKKRTRLIKAGADIMIPDFSQMNTLLAMLNIGEVL